MADYEGRLANAHFDDQVAQIRLLLDSFPSDYLPIIDREDDGVLERMQTVLDHVLVVTSAANPLLVPESWLEELTSALANLRTALGNLEGLDEHTITVPLVAQLTLAIDSVARELAAWPFQPSEGDWREAVSQAASTYRRSLGQQISALAGELETLEESQNSLREAIRQATEEQRDQNALRAQEIATDIANLQRQLEEVGRQQAAVESQLTNSISRADQAIATQQQQFAEAQERRTREAAEARDKLIEDATESLRLQEVDADALLSAIKQHVDEAANLVSVFAAAGTANAYSKEAKEQGDKADHWRYGAIGLGVASGIAAVTILFGISNGDKGWQLLIGKLAISITFGGLAGYAARQSARHRRREESARHLELNLATFGSLSEDLAESDLERARAQLVSTMLARDEATAQADAELETLGPAQMSLIERLLEAVSKQR